MTGLAAAVLGAVANIDSVSSAPFTPVRRPGEIAGDGAVSLALHVLMALLPGTFWLYRAERDRRETVAATAGRTPHVPYRANHTSSGPRPQTPYSAHVLSLHIET
ncbi:hypothetical protein GCM10020220_054630 [Nonomuraea rubra]